MTDRNDRLGPYWNPDPKLVEQRNERGVTLSYVGHVHTTATLDQIDPDWQLDISVDVHGVPIINSRSYQLTTKEGRVWKEGTVLTMWGRLTLLGSSRWCVGSVEADKADAEKELIGDLVRNGAMRHGVFAGLWAKDKPAKAPESHAQPRKRPAPVETPVDLSEWGDDALSHAVWTQQHVEKIAGLLRSKPDRIMDRLLTGMAEKGHPVDEGWAGVPEEDWVRAVLKFESWAERQAAEREAE